MKLSALSISDKIISLIRENSTPEPNTGCWLWVKSSNKDGYGTMSVGGKIMTASRASYLAHTGDPTGKIVCHKCDTPACVNPSHLFLGTYSENLKDCYSKGRHGKINRDTFKEIKRLLSAGKSIRSIAKEYGVHHSAITWRLAHVNEFDKINEGISMPRKATT